MGLLQGANIAPKTSKDAKQLIGKNVQFLRNQDIDKSGRGYFFPRNGTIEDVVGKNLLLENGEMIHFSELVEMVEASKST
ncbi:hypothetical protein [Paenibacillus sp. USHLN196]|uniref:hypothetical protein n=1 Tax=Paenibacillus sp. USHLN196 TaxID=3081291 RepID=UPI00301B504A